jgi:hypothetical protein
MMRTSSAFCSSVLSPGRDGQSMFATVAIQAARNSRGAGGIARSSSSLSGTG